MSDGTHIEWTDATVNAVNGCSVTSPGCTNCYAMRLAGTRLKHHESRAGLTIDTKAGPVWNGEVRLNETALLQPLRWRRPRKIFWNAHGDLFHPKVPVDWIHREFAVMALTPQHIHQVLTKRADRMREVVTSPGFHTAVMAAAAVIANRDIHLDDFPHFPLPNVWLGTSVEDQVRADERIPHLLATPAAVRFLSCEPLLGPVDFAWALSHPVEIAAGFLERGHFAPGLEKLRHIDWVIVGGESGPKARAMHPDWARALREHCALDGVPFFFKQWGEWGPDEGPGEDGRDRVMEGTGPCAVRVDGEWRQFRDGFAVPIELCSGHGECVYRLGKKATGRRLDGVEHNGMPEVHT